ncbi:MAG: nucleotidyltransferase substrate binding protein [Defluviitaleaceae bacterium]|nr:nucleotidyltransferase substrate binding protein [Defluviitaleaceae bacterium]
MEKLLRFKQRRQKYDRALRLLVDHSKKQEFDDVDIAAMIHFFEMAFELGWKMLKDLLEEEGGIIAKSPREVIKKAFEADYIKDGHLWTGMLESRNIVAHTYDEGIAKDLIDRVLQSYIQPLEKLGSDAASLG